MSGRRDLIARIILEHSYDYELGECMCGYQAQEPGLAQHVAEQIERVLP